MIAKHLRETIEGDAAGRMVHVMHPDIVSEPSQGRRQCIVGASVESRFVKAPIVTMSPKRAFELIEKALNGCLRELFICRQGDDVAAASMIEIAGVGVM